MEAPVKNNMGNQEQLAILFGGENHRNKLKRGVGYQKETHPSLLATDKTSSLESVILYTLSEIDELETEYFDLMDVSKSKKRKLSS